MGLGSIILEWVRRPIASYQLERTGQQMSLLDETRVLTDEANSNPLEHAGPISRLHVGYVSPFIIKGNTTFISTSELIPLHPFDKVQWSYRRLRTSLGDSFHDLAQSPHILRILLKTFYSDILESAISRACYATSGIIVPYILSLFIDFLDAPGQSLSWGLSLLCILFTIQVIAVLVIQEYWLSITRAGMRIESSLAMLLYEKTMRLQLYGSITSSGELTNLISSDLRRLRDAVFNIHFVWATPLVLTFTLVMCFSLFGWAVIGPIVLVIFAVPINLLVSRFMVKARRQLVKRTDARISREQELVETIKAVKLYGLRAWFRSDISTLRKRELARLFVYSAVQNLHAAFNNAFPAFLTCALIFCAFAFGASPSAGAIYAAIGVFTFTRYPIFIFGRVVAILADSYVSITRINKYLHLEEQRDFGVPCVDDTMAVELADVSAGWEAEPVGDGEALLGNVDVEVALQGISMDVKKGELVMVIGDVGAGKSTLLYTILGETSLVEGAVRRSGSVSFVSHHPWMLHRSVRDNITFNAPFQQEWYDKVVEACALLPDFAMFPLGDLTEIGEKGINISGGQKQRISLARAIYANTDVVLLDDPLSAVDVHVGRHICEHAISGLLSSKTVVLVTHQLQFLHLADRIAYMENGTVVQYGDRESISEAYNIEEAMEKHGYGGGEDSQYQHMVDELADKGEVKVVEKKGDSKIEDEGMMSGNVEFTSYWSYFGSYYGILWTFTLLSYLAAGIFVAGADYVVGKWGQAQSNTYLYLYGLFMVAITATFILRSFGTTISAILSCEQVHSRLIDHLLYLPMQYYERTPIGRVTTRFSRDTDNIDQQLPLAISFAVPSLVRVLVAISILLYSVPIAIFPLMGILVLTYIVQRLYRTPSREIKRLEGVLSAPVFSIFGESLAPGGLSYIRTFHAQNTLLESLRVRVSAFCACFLTGQMVDRWITSRVQILIYTLSFFVSLYFTYFREGTSSTTAGLVLVYLGLCANFLTWGIRGFSEIEVNMASVERCAQVSVEPLERPAVCPEVDPKAGWPERGQIDFKGVDVAYSEDGPIILKGVTIQIPPQTKVGIVGKTGSGKSTLLNVLTRIIEPVGGRIEIDGLDIQQMGLDRLRDCFSVVPQDPTFVQETFRFNLDPLDIYSDEEIRTVLSQVMMLDYVQSLPNQLDEMIGENGSSLSFGQRQLISLAKAMLRKAPILLLDEATSGVDFDTDHSIQRILRTHFSDCTIFCIAHRLSSIIDYDMILRVGNGQVDVISSADLSEQDIQ